MISGQPSCHSTVECIDSLSVAKASSTAQHNAYRPALQQRFSSLTEGPFLGPLRQLRSPTE